MNNQCFVIQPFDQKYNDRYQDTFKNAIIKAGLEPYRVDGDDSAKIPIETIEREIKLSKICFAEITTNNPNVWYEVGYASAMGKDVVLVCCITERGDTPFPFDVRHKKIITYKGDSKSDFEKLESNICNTLKAYLSAERYTDSSLKIVIDNALQMACRAFCLPKSPEELRVRSFIFQKTGNKLICKHYYSPYKSKEQVERLEFDLNDDQSGVVVVKAAMNNETTSGEINTQLQKDIATKLDIEDNLLYIIATPIYVNNSLWGIVDFDTSHEDGMELLKKTNFSKAAICQLAEHIQSIVSYL